MCRKREMSMSHEFCKRRCRPLPLRLLHALECFSRVTKRHRGQETMVCVIRSLKWRFCTQSRLIFAFLYPIAVFHSVLKTLNASSFFLSIFIFLNYFTNVSINLSRINSPWYMMLTLNFNVSFRTFFVNL